MFLSHVPNSQTPPCDEQCGLTLTSALKVSFRLSMRPSILPAAKRICLTDCFPRLASIG